MKCDSIIGTWVDAGDELNYHYCENEATHRMIFDEMYSWLICEEHAKEYEDNNDVVMWTLSE